MYQRETVLPELELYETEDPEALRAAGPSIGPIHTGVIPAPPELRKGVGAAAVISPLAITLRGIRGYGSPRKAVRQIIVHCTGSGPAAQSKKTGYKKPAIQFALDAYFNGEIFPHYVIDFPGTIYATGDERLTGAHTGWSHKALFQQPGWRPPQWWLNVWQKFGFKTPLDLLPQGVSGPNSGSIGIELLITSRNGYTDAQYRALARLIADIARRQKIPIASAPGPTLLGHEDFAPFVGARGRANSGGGWDPGAHRSNPFFSWSRLWSYLSGMVPRASVPAPSPRPGSGPAPAPSPAVAPSQFRKFRLTAYHVADQNAMPTGSVRIPILDANRRKIAEASPRFFADLSLQGTGRLSDGRLINVVGGKNKFVPVSDRDYAPVWAYHRQAYRRPAPAGYSGIVVNGGRVTHALAFQEVPASRRGAGFGKQNGIDLRPFRTLAADLGRTPRSDPRWRGKGGLVPVGTRVYIRELDGKPLPDGTRHDGWFVVNDTGGAIFGAHFDVFVGSRALRTHVPEIGHIWFQGIEQRIPPDYTYGLKK